MTRACSTTGAARPSRAPGAPLAVRMRPRTWTRSSARTHLLGRGLAAAPAGRRAADGDPVVADPVGPARHRQDDARAPGRAADRARGSSSCPRSTPASRTCGRSSSGARASSACRARDGAVRRRGAPLLQDPAGRAAARGREPLGDPGRRDHREPVLLASISPLLSPQRCCSPCAADDDDVRELLRPGRHRRARAGRRRSRSTDDAEDHLVRLAGGDARRALTALEAAAGAALDAGAPYGRPGRPSSAPSTGRPCATTATATSTTTSSARFIKCDPRLRRRRRAALPGADDRGGGGPAVHRPPAGDPGQRGHRAGRPDRAADRGRRGAGGAADRDAGGPDQPRPGGRSTGPGAQVQRGDPRDRRGHRRRTAGPDGAVPAAPARRPLRAAPAELGPRRGATSTPTTYPAGSPRSSTRPTPLGDRRYYQPTRHGAEARLRRRLDRLRVVLGRDPAPPPEPAGSD